MAALAPRMRVAAEAALARWSEAQCERDVAAETSAITFDVVLDTILSGGEDFNRATLRARIEAFLAEQGRMKATYFFAPDAFHADRVNPDTAEGVQLREEIARMVRRRRTAPARGDLVDLLMAAADPESGRPMDDETLRDNLLGFIVAGFGTRAVALAWSLYLVSEHAPTAERLRAEVDAVTGGGPVEADHVERLVFTRAVISEAMRLYPPAHTLTRVAGRTLEVAGVTIRKGARVLIPIYALHRHRLYWRDPDVFDPGRFGASAPSIDRHVYMPFGAGARICLGAAFATTELVVVLATLVRGARFAMREGHEVAPVTGLTLQPRGGLPMRVTSRCR
jgi:cytochrome P450